MANQVIVPRPQRPDTERNQVASTRPRLPASDVPNLNLLPEVHQSLLGSLYRNLRDALFPEKLPPLRLTSRPVPVREIWTRPNRKKATTGSLMLHGLGLAALIVFSIIELRPKPEVKPQQTVTYVAPLSDYQPVMEAKPAPKHSPVFRFAIPAEVARPALDLSKGLRASPFMLLLAAYNLVLSRRLGSTDVVVPTLTAGRTEPRFQDTVGPFFNFVPLRTDLEGAETFRDVVSRTRTSCLEAMSYEVPFGQILGEAPTLMRPLTEDNLAACAFQVWQFSTVMDRERVGDLEISEVRTRVLNQADGTDIPDGALLTLDIDPSGVIFGNIAYNSNLYTESTVAGLVSDYTDLLAKAVDAPDAPLSGF